MPRVALPIETKVRELNGKVWLAANLAQRGYKVALGELTSLKTHLDLIKPHIYIGDSAVPKDSRVDLYSRLKRANVAVAVHDTEGGIIYSHDYYKGRLSSNVLPFVDCFLAWGQETAGIFREVWDEKSVVLEPVGNPSFDLLSRQYRDFYSEEKEAIQSKFSDFVLVNTHFGFYNHFDNKTYIDPVKAKFPGLYEFKKKLYFKFVESLHTLSQNNPDINFVIRPHPSESFDSYIEEFASRDNIFVEHNNSVHPWILAAKVVIHNGCTTGVESAMLEKPVISYRPIKNDKWDVHLPNFVSEEAVNIDQLQKYIDKYCKDFDQDILELGGPKKEILERVLHFLDGKTAERIADAFDQLQIPADINIKRINKTSLKKMFSSRVKQFMVAGNLMKNDGVKQSGYAVQKFDALTQGEIEDLLRRYQKIDPKLSRVRVEPFEEQPNLYWVTAMES